MSSCRSATNATGAWSDYRSLLHVQGRQLESVSIVAVKGGKVPIDAGRLGTSCEHDKRFEESGNIAALENTRALDQVKIQVMIEDIDCLFHAGGHGIFVAFEERLADIVTRSYAAGKAVAAVCHGTIGFVGAKDGAGPIVRRQKVAGFSNDVEKTVGLYGKVPNVLETKFEELDAKYVEDETFKRYAVRDERLVTGQNPMSSMTCAGSALEILEWFLEADFSMPRDQACKVTFFCGGMLFRRTTAPTMKRYVDEALARFREEEPFSRCMYEVLDDAGLTDERTRKRRTNTWQLRLRRHTRTLLTVPCWQRVSRLQCCRSSSEVG